MHTPTTNTTDDRRPHVDYVIGLGVEGVGLMVGGCGFGTQGLGLGLTVFDRKQHLGMKNDST